MITVIFRPDLVPLRISEEWIEKLTKNLPELPAARRLRFQTEYELPDSDAEVLTSEKALADYFEATVKEFSRLNPKKVSNWLMMDPSSMSTMTPATSGSFIDFSGKGSHQP